MVPCTMPTFAANVRETEQKTLRVPVAEDNPINQKLARSLLESNQGIVDVAENGFLAIAMHKRQAYDVILMDMQMPEMGGIEATKNPRDGARRCPCSYHRHDCERHARAIKSVASKRGWIIIYRNRLSLIC